MLRIIEHIYNSSTNSQPGDVIYYYIYYDPETIYTYDSWFSLEAPVNAVSLVNPPQKIDYSEYEEIDLTGLIVRVHKADGTNYLRDEFTGEGWTPFVDATDFGLHTLTINAYGFDVNFDVYYNRFKDVKHNHWAFEPIDFIASQAIVSGYEDGTFRPNNNLTRAEAAKMIVGALGLELTGSTSNFSDDRAGSWSYEFVSAAYQAGIITGYQDGTFKPNGRITRADISAMLSRAFEISTGTINVNFPDVSSGNCAYTVIRNLSSNGIIKGYQDGTFKPNNLVTRAEFTSMLSKSMNY